jgi:hypothetical protein
MPESFPEKGFQVVAGRGKQANVGGILRQVLCAVNGVREVFSSLSGAILYLGIAFADNSF